MNTPADAILIVAVASFILGVLAGLAMVAVCRPVRPHLPYAHVRAVRDRRVVWSQPEEK